MQLELISFYHLLYYFSCLHLRNPYVCGLGLGILEDEKKKKKTAADHFSSSPRWSVYLFLFVVFGEVCVCICVRVLGAGEREEERGR